ncbi:MAG: methyltransferase domain-containing protein [Planctomycetota bacterium]
MTGPGGLQVRRREPELMDQPGLNEQEHRAALRGLARANLVSRTAAQLWRPIRALAREAAAGSKPGVRNPAAPKLSVLDIATGAGDVPVRLGRMARRAGIALELHACDCSRRAIAAGCQAAARAGVAVEFFPLDVLRELLPGRYDVVISSLFLHHLDGADAVRLLRKMADAADRLVLVSDLQRGAYGLLTAWLGTRMLTRSRVVQIDGERSVRAAFTLSEARALAAQAGLAGATLRRSWPARFLLEWRRT